MHLPHSTTQQCAGKSFGTRVGGGDMAVLNEMVASGYLGRKSGKGIFEYTGSSSARKPNEGAQAIINKHRLASKGWYEYVFVTNSHVFLQRFKRRSSITFGIAICQ
jgi:3-hydroxyacyl-CoA dehydrogenase